MPDDLDDLLRRTMKTLDDQVPSGYFDALPERTLLRLDQGKEAEMQHTTSSSSGPTKAPITAPITTPPASKPAAPVVAPVVAPIARDVATGVPAAPTKREEDSGLHDIRNLAQSTKQRISHKRITTNPPMSRDDEDVLASSSASWKNLALPQPAKMVSLPEIDQLPSKQDVIAQDKAAKAAAKQAARDAKLEAKTSAMIGDAAPAGPVTTLAPATATGQATAPVEFKPAFSSFADRAPKKASASNKGRTIALVGMGLAAAAGITIFVATQNGSKSSDAEAPAASRAKGEADHSLAEGKAKLDEATAKLQAQHEAAEKQAAEAANAPAAGAAAQEPTATVDTAKDKDDASASRGAVAAPASATKAVAHHGKKAEKTKDDAKPVEVKAPEPTKKVGKGEPGDPSFDELLKEAGVDQKKGTDKPKLDKKALSGDDFKKGMAAVQAKAQACFKGTQGTADVKLTVSPSGQVSKVIVGGIFKGKPEADCVASAVKSAAFPPWDGGPQSFGYPILLSE